MWKKLCMTMAVLMVAFMCPVVALAADIPKVTQVFNTSVQYGDAANIKNACKDDNGIVIAGVVTGGPTVTNGGFVSKLDFAANKIWSTTITADGFVRITSVKRAGSGYVVAGASTDYIEGKGDVSGGLIVVLDSGGNVVWQKTYTGQPDSYFRDVALVNGEYCAVGQTGRNNNAKALFVSFDSSGNVKQEIVLSQYTPGYFTNITSSGLAIGNGSEANKVDQAICMRKSGSTMTGYAYAREDFPSTEPSVVETSDGAVLAGLAGSTPYWHGAIVKVDNNGKLLWSNTFKGKDGSESTTRYNFLVEKDGKFYAFGVSDAIDGDLTGMAYEMNTNNEVHRPNERGIVTAYDKNGNLLERQSIQWLDNDDFSFGNILSYPGGFIGIGNKYINMNYIPSFKGFTIPKGIGPYQDGSSQTGSKNGWVQRGSAWYYYINNVAQRGWQKVGSSWYFLDRSSGAMKTGWLKDGSAWYYLKPSGAMATGWVQDGGLWYYLESSGKMKTGWLKQGSTWYYLKDSGAMATGWQKVGSDWYWFESSGAMVTGTKVIGGKTYRFNSSGAWIS